MAVSESATGVKNRNNAARDDSTGSGSWLLQPLDRPKLYALTAAWLLVSVSAEVAWSRATPWEIIIVDWLCGLAWFIAGITVWLRRSGTVFGPLIVLVAFAFFNLKFLPVGNEWIGLYAILTDNVALIFLLLLIFSYPTGKIGNRYERVTIAITVAWLIAFPIVDAFTMPYAYRFVACNLCDQPIAVNNPVAFLETSDASDLFYETNRILMSLFAALFIGLLGLRFLRATPTARAALTPLWIAAGLIATWFVLQRGESGDYVMRLLFGIGPSRTEELVIFWLERIVFALIPVAFLSGLRQMDQLRGPVGRFVEDLDTASESSALDGLIRQALGDPDARVYIFSEDGETLTDGSGVQFDMREAVGTRASVKVEHRGASLGILVHDPALLAQPELLRSVSAAAGLALANERLRAKVQAQLAEVESSRARIVQAADAERRRIERNLHDGAQQRLVALRLSLRLSAEQAKGRDPASASLFDRSALELDEAISELRELAQGIHPAILTDEGLTAATEVLLERSKLLADFRNTLPSRPPPSVEAAAYYVVAEALSNIAKHAQATMVRVNLEHDEGRMVVKINDNGIGGADLKRGSGLEGLSDRVAAVGGHLEISSPPAGGTTLTATLPWEEP